MTSSFSTMLRLSLVLAAMSTAACAGGEDAGSGGSIEGDVQDFGTGPKLAFDEYSVLFTNPVCKTYKYEGEVLSNAGKKLTQKPKNAYCTSSDGPASAERESSPQNKLLSWINDAETKEIFFTYLSFSNRVVAAALCSAIKERNVKVTMVLDRETDLGAANSVLACKPGNGDPKLNPRLELRGHDATIGFAHNKVFMVNPHGDKPRIVFSSGNLSSGVVLHHENWHFVQTPSRTHFARAHLCLMDGMLDHFRTKKEFGDFIKGCRDGAGIGEESDIKTFFVPGDGGRAGLEIQKGIRESSFIGINAHRFSFSLMKKELDARLKGASKPTVQLTVDDDIWWAGHGKEDVPNTPDEFENVEAVAKLGVDVRYVETNQDNGLLHHNKFMVFSRPNGDSVFTGAGNFTGTAFTDNFENFYFITIPHVVKAMKEQQKHLFELGTESDDLPETNARPKTN